MTHRAEQHIAFQWVGPTRVGDAYCQARVYAVGRYRYIGVHIVPEAHTGSDCMLLQRFMQQCWQISAAACLSGSHISGDHLHSGSLMHGHSYIAP